MKNIFDIILRFFVIIIVFAYKDSFLIDICLLVLIQFNKSTKKLRNLSGKMYI